MSVLLDLMILNAHAVAAGPGAPRLLAGGPETPHVLAGGPLIPPSPAQPIPGLNGPIGTILGWIKWSGLIGGVFGLSWCGFKMLIGHRNRSSLAADGASSVPWVLFGLSLIAISPALVVLFL